MVSVKEAEGFLDVGKALRDLDRYEIEYLPQFLPFKLY